MELRHRIAIAALLFVLLGGALAVTVRNGRSAPPPIVITTPAGAATTPAVAATPSAPPSAPAPAPVPTAPPSAPAAAAPAVPPATPPAATSDTTAIFVHVAGAVKKPNVYKLHVGARVFNAIEAAGGAKDTASLDSINLAEKLVDAEKIYVPTKAEARDMGPQPAISGGPSSGDSGESKPSGPKDKGAKGDSKGKDSGSDTPDKLTDPKQGTVSLHGATLEQLERLPGVGPAIAQRILDYRHEVGGFKSLDDLRNVSGIGEKKFAKLRPFVRL